MTAADSAAAMPLIPAAVLVKLVRKAGIRRMPRSRKVLSKVGVFPIVDHYYEPLFQTQSLERAGRPRSLPGIDFDVEGQLETIRGFTYADELLGIEDDAPGGYRLDNQLFEAGDGECWYSIIRSRKPSRIFEIGSGNSTLVALKALAANRAEDPGYDCRHVCVEPYEMAWLEQHPVEVVRQRVEELGAGFFEELEAGDILFIDSSHMIRPGGDVLFEYLQLLPRLKPGVLVHVHDIFTPREYPDAWLIEDVRFWNEQYLLEAYLTENPHWKIVISLNHLWNTHPDELRAVFPHIDRNQDPGSFYLEKVVPSDT